MRRGAQTLLNGLSKTGTGHMLVANKQTDEDLFLFIGLACLFTSWACRNTVM